MIASKGRPVTQSSAIEVDLETSRGSNLLSAEFVSFKEKVNARLWVMLNRPPSVKMDDIDEHYLIWGKFMSSSMNAAVFLARDYTENLHSIRYTDGKPTVKKLFDVTQNLISE